MLDQLFTLSSNTPQTQQAHASEEVELLSVDFKEELTITEGTHQEVESKSQIDGFDNLSTSKEFLYSLKASLEGVQKNIAQALTLISVRLNGDANISEHATLENLSHTPTKALPLENPSLVGHEHVEWSNPPHVQVDGSVVEGSFDGQHMIGINGKQYTIPANYASKSKLVEGDTLKLTITPQGSFVYKQIHPIDRRRLLGTLEFNADTREYCVRAESRTWRVLMASITYYKGVPGDEIAIIIPREMSSAWAAVEHIIKKC